jgi:predicted amidohydrolase YtcJ
MQPSHAPSDWVIADRYLGERARLGYAWRTIRDSGAPLAFGSDCPVEPIDPLAGLHAAVTRQTIGGEPTGGWYPEECLTADEALAAFTLGSAFASGEETMKGSVEAGKLADFVVLDADPLAGAPDLFLRAKVEATVIGGRVAYGDLG